MTRKVACACVLSVAVGCLVSEASSRGSSATRSADIWIAVSPQTIVLGLDKGASVTVHTDIPLGVVDRTSIELSGVPSSYTKADSRGNLVAKFHQEEIEAIVSPPEATLVLTGMTEDGVPFSGSDTVRVIADPAPED